MYKVILRNNNRDKRKLKIRSRISGTSERPRLSVFRSNKYIYAQLIDDVAQKTLLDTQKETKQLHTGTTKTEAALQVGLLIAKKAKENNIESIIFDRNGYKYHGRVKNVAEGARQGGLSV